MLQPHLCILTKPSSLSAWNQLIQSATARGLFQESLQLFSSMVQAGLRGDHLTLPFVAKSCGKICSPRDGWKVHAFSVLMGLDEDVFVKTSLMDMYSKCRCLDDSRKLFDEMPVRSVVSWNSMVSAYSKDLQVDRAFQFFNEMRVSGVSPNSTTFVSLVPSCMGPVSVLHQGMSLHCYAVKAGCLSDLIFSNSLMNMYLRFDLVDCAHSMFDSMGRKSTASWTIMIGGFMASGNCTNALKLFRQMHREHIELDHVAFVQLASASSLLGILSFACTLHALLMKCGCLHGYGVANSLVNMYSKCGDLQSAQKIFNSVIEKDIFSWTSMISGYLHNGFTSEALSLFQELLTTINKPNEVTVITVLSACSSSGSLEIGEKLDEYIKANRMGSDLRVQTSLIDMYSRCGDIEKAKKIFRLAPTTTRDLALWTAMINGCAMHGMAEEALALFKDMLRQDEICPDSITFTCVLTACSHSGLVEEGLGIFKCMQKDFGIEPSMEHYSCLVDLLARAGNLDLASEIIQQVPVQIRKKVLAPLLSSSKNQSYLEQFLSELPSDLGTHGAGIHASVANAYASLGKWVEALEIRKSMNNRGLVKEGGWSMLESNNYIFD